MSRSYRRPASAITTCNSAKQDKILAHRGVRRAQNHALRTCQDWDELLIPHKYECSWNETYCWGRDGKQRLYFLSDFEYLWVHPITGIIEPLHENGAEMFAALKRK
jgi:hypothetical protein